MSEATEETFNLSYLYSLSPRLSLGSERDIILYGASCHAGARLCRSPGVSLALHPICRVLATTGRPAVRMRSPRLGPHTLLAATAQPAHRTPKGPPCLVPGRSTKPSAHRHISISFSLFAPSLFPLSSGPSPLCRHFSPFSDFPDRLRLLLWWMSLIISFQSQEEERGGSQFRTIALTGETVSPWLPRGNGAEMDSCYEHRGGDNWWCLLAQWLHSASPRWIVVSLPGWAEPLQGPHSASLTKPAEQTKCHSWSALAMKKYGLVPLSCYYGSVLCLCSACPSVLLSHVPTQPHAKHWLVRRSVWCFSKWTKPVQLVAESQHNNSMEHTVY